MHRSRLFAATVLVGVLASIPPRARAQSPEDPPPLPREFRGAWVASVNNSTWPPEPGMSPDAQRKEAIRQLDRVVELKMNAVVFQVRPAADALYRSNFEPWSEYLSGTQGKDPGYDPLEFWIEEAHKRGLELHAWFNPYRAKHKDSKSPVARDHISKKFPNVVKQYDGYLWMDPGEPAAARQSLAVFLDVVKRYDVDGIHMDDYFYPYRGGEKREFPDEPSWQRYQRSGGKLARNDWRRDNVNQFMAKLYADTKRLKPHVKVGIAPFGIWRPNHPPGIVGLDQYNVLYADAKLWLNEGWLDYFSPQLYWPIEGPQSFTKLLDWWLSENPKQRHIWPGQSVGRYNPKDKLSMEVPNQLAAIRQRADKGATGFIFWPLQTVLRDTPLSERLKANEFAEPALIPTSPWLDDDPPAKPIVDLAGRGDSATIELRPGRLGGRNEDVFLWAIQARFGDTWKLAIVPAHVKEIPTEGATALAISAVDRTGNASERVVVQVPGAGGVAPTTTPAATTTATAAQ
ncbi:MAG TPA: family 10 glycosylhydrolase [Tepidisphaeraceae bacterium]|nr:family 10 glycosylhydrolase [Tepidisphaeraceae bacterium]